MVVFDEPHSGRGITKYWEISYTCFHENKRFKTTLFNLVCSCNALPDYILSYATCFFIFDIVMFTFNL